MPKQVAPCLFCGAMPCECVGKKKPSVKKATVSKPSVSTALPSPPIVTDTSPIPSWFGNTKPKLAAPEKAQTQEELMLREALRNLECIMHPASKKELHDTMYPKRDAELSRERVEVRKSLGR